MNACSPGTLVAVEGEAMMTGKKRSDTNRKKPDDLDENPGIGQSKGLFSRAGSEDRSEEHTSELQSLMRISYAVFCLKKKKKNKGTSRAERCKDHTEKSNKR